MLKSLRAVKHKGSTRLNNIGHDNTEVRLAPRSVPSVLERNAVVSTFQALNPCQEMLLLNVTRGFNFDQDVVTAWEEKYSEDLDETRMLPNPALALRCSANYQVFMGVNDTVLAGIQPSMNSMYIKDS